MIITAPTPAKFNSILFLAGTIDNGESEDWQDKVAKRLEPQFDIILNPRRKNWNPAQQDITKQILWELRGLSISSTILFNFLPNSKSPVTMLELGVALGTECDVIIVCPDEFYRSTNVKTTAAYFGKSTYNSLEEVYEDYNW